MPPTGNGMRYQRTQFPLKIDGLDAARDFFAGCLAESDTRNPILWGAHVDEESRCIHVSCHERGEEEAIPIETIIPMPPTIIAPASCSPTIASATARGPVTAIAASLGGSPWRPRRSTARSSIIWCLKERSARASGASAICTALLSLRSETMGFASPGTFDVRESAIGPVPADRLLQRPAVIAASPDISNIEGASGL